MSSRSRTQIAAPSIRTLWTLGSMLLIGAAAAAFSVNALAGDHRGHKGNQHAESCMHMGGFGPAGAGLMGETRRLDRMLGDVGLTDAQRTQIRDIQTKARADLKALHEGDGAAMPHGLSLLTQAKPDAAAAEKARQQMLARHDKVSQRMLQAQLDVANVLTPAQRAKMATQMKARQDRMAERAQRRAAHHAERAASQPAAAPSAPR
ncbi:MAG: Spy/CpxP family protein refolding chaperone [Aquabacterium sp.]|jgi:Spy/CpxP family protein refolding chaperone|uniref:Spy/CpxP family protein refolding chaperone n=1 Tax=Aquabacterium sp. TaxID=1872578 RepID=UPI001B3EB8ED|nr:Spy/CpxP family protein refolding chaperone [Aquabacterium sp.]MBP7132675.1 Spy/CpxP family protein refolding chaperone [Aquabacterium sp.]MDQ5925709.1 periplasmic protein CpxP/Spy [Pseudomonadota bacterium]